MRRTKLIMPVVALLGMVLAAQAFANGSSEMATRLNKDVTTMNSGTSGGSSGTSAVVSALEMTFNVTADQIAALRAQDLGYGEIAIVLSLAQTMSGGITQDNINAVLALHTSDKGWGQVAQAMGVNLGSVVSSVEKAEKDSGVKVDEETADASGAPETEKASSHSSAADNHGGVEVEKPDAGGHPSGTGGDN